MEDAFWSNETTVSADPTSSAITPAAAGPELSQWIHKVEGRICAFEYENTIKYYACRRHEYCCGVGCCVSPAFAFYQLWYFWLMVILLFLLCSGGGWWYRSYYWPRLAPTPPPEPLSVRRRHHMQAATRTAPTANRVTHAFMPQREQVVIHTGWKAFPYNLDPENPPPPYSAVALPLSQCSSVQEHQQDTNDPSGSQNVPNPSANTVPSTEECPPPPSYEFVMQQQQQQQQQHQEQEQEQQEVLEEQVPAEPQEPSSASGNSVQDVGVRNGTVSVEVCDPKLTRRNSAAAAAERS